MDDVVTRLRNQTIEQSTAYDLMADAAREIDRLRSERDGLAEKAKLHDYMQEVAKANGYDCLTDAITKANAYGKERDSLVEQLDEIRLTARRWYVNGVELRAQLAAAVELEREIIERCAKIAEREVAYDDGLQKSAGCDSTGQRIARLIRALSDTTAG